MVSSVSVDSSDQSNSQNHIRKRRRASPQGELAQLFLLQMQDREQREERRREEEQRRREEEEQRRRDEEQRRREEEQQRRDDERRREDRRHRGANGACCKYREKIVCDHYLQYNLILEVCIQITRYAPPQ